MRNNYTNKLKREAQTDISFLELTVNEKKHLSPQIHFSFSSNFLLWAVWPITWTSEQKQYISSCNQWSDGVRVYNANEALLGKETPFIQAEM